MSEPFSISASTIELPLLAPEIYYEPGKNRYWSINGDNIWSQSYKEDMLHKLAKLGYNARPAKGKVYSEAQDYLLDIRHDKSIGFAGPVAGHMPGVKMGAEGRYLVTKGPTLIPPVRGTWSYIKGLGTRLFGETQLEYVLGWSKSAVTSLYSGVPKRGQILVLAGPANCGKSFWQKRVITPMLGGRIAKPIQYMIGDTSFNEDIIKAEHLMLEDETAGTDYKSRMAFGAAIKNFTVNTSQRLHGKGKEPVMIDSSHWVSMSLNDEPENLSVLPPIDAGLEDKVMLMKCNKAITDEWPKISNAELEAKIAEEMPAFLHYLIHEHEIRNELQELRMGIKAYHHPELLDNITALTPEGEMEMVIDRVFTEERVKGGKIEINAFDLQHRLEMDVDVGWKTRKMFPSAIVCGKYLERLAKHKPGKFSRQNLDRTKRGGKWVISWEFEKSPDTPHHVTSSFRCK